MTRFSVVVPVWNSADYLEKCLQSVLTQSFTGFELVVVDDGSTDGSSEILERFVRQDSRVRVIRQANLGPGVARNRGIAAAIGDYLYLLDSDDWIVAKALEKLSKRIEHTSADVVYFESLNSGRSVAAPRWVRRRRTRLSSTVWPGEQYLSKALAARAYSYSPCLQVIKRCLVTDQDIRFPPHRMSEDAVFSVKVTLAAERVSYLNDALFYRRLRPGSLTTTGGANIDTIRGSILASVALAERRGELAPTSVARPAVQIIVKRLWRHALHVFDRLPKPIKASIHPQNILEDDLELSRRFLRHTRSGHLERLLSRRLLPRKPLDIEPAPTPKTPG